MILDPKFPRNCWPKGRVIATHTASDGQVRRVTVQTASRGIYERPAISLAVLDVGVEVNTQPEDPLRIPGGSVNYAPSIGKTTVPPLVPTPLDDTRYYEED